MYCFVRHKERLVSCNNKTVVCKKKLNCATGTCKIRLLNLKAISQHFPGDAEENQDSHQNRQSGARCRNSGNHKWVVNILGREIMQKLQQRSPLTIHGHKEHEKRGKTADESSRD
jgi:hypothetical protein